MKKIFSISLIATLMLIFSIATFANTPFINRRERNQEKRIFHGVSDRELTFHEYQKLEKEQAAIHAYERRAKSNGVVTFRERLKLDRMQDRASRDIYRQTHDRQDRIP